MLLCDVTSYFAFFDWLNAFEKIFFKFSSWLLLLLWKLKSCVLLTPPILLIFGPISSDWALEKQSRQCESSPALVGFENQRTFWLAWKPNVHSIMWPFCTDVQVLAFWHLTPGLIFTKKPQKTCVCFQPQTSWRNVWFKSTLDFQYHSRITAASDFSLGSRLFRSVAGVQIKSSKYV